MPDTPYYFPNATLDSMAGFYAGQYPGMDRAGVSVMAESLELDMHRPLRTFSKGMKRQAFLILALCAGTKYLLCDEVFDGLDPIARDDILDVFMEFTRSEEHSILISSHIISDLEKICDYVAFLHKGRLLFCEEKDVLEEEYGLLTLRREDFQALDPAAVVSSRDSGYGVEALVRRDMVPEGLRIERAGIERIIVAMAKEAK